MNTTTPRIGWQPLRISMKGPSQDQKQLAKDQAAFYGTVQKNYNEKFAGQTAILKALTDAFTPILSAGPNQKGMSGAEETAYRTSATDRNAAAYAAAQRAMGETYAARGGGNAFLPSGAEAQLTSERATLAAQQEADTQNQITAQNYGIGRDNYFKAASIMGNTAQLYDPSSAGTLGLNAGNSAFGSATKVQEMKNASSPWATIGGILAGAAGNFISGKSLFTPKSGGTGSGGIQDTFNDSYKGLGGE